MSQALYRKWRPQTFDQMVGQEHITGTLRHAIAAGRISHAYLFTGPRGTGKTTTARLLAKAVNCLDPDPTQRPCNKCATCVAITQGRLLDLVELDAASNRGIDEIRNLRDKIHFSPGEGRYKFYVIDECFRYEDLVTLADGSKMPIGKIVESALHVEVLSYNEHTHRIEPKPVVRYMRKQPALPMVRITFDNNRVLACTLNHKFYTPTGLFHAGELEVGQFIYANYERMTEHQLTVIAGAALGDGHIALTGSQMRARLSINQGVAQKDYLDYKMQLMGDLVETPPTYQYLPQSYSSKGTFHLATASRPQIAELHRELYDPHGRKRISPSYLDRLTSLGLALWYLDDGSLVTQSNPYERKDGTVTHYPATRSTLSVYGFSLEEAHVIEQWLQERWGIEGGVTATAKGPVIWLTLEGTKRLHEVIAPYVPPSMAYKLLPAYHNRFCPPTDDGTPSGLAVSIVRHIERVPSPDFVYNIEVADNHNYFARDILVANCHMLTTEAFNALLKTLEEPPPHAIFVLATTDPQKVPATIVSRCQRFDFRRLTLAEITQRLQEIVADEGLSAEPDVLTLVARQATGAMRDAESLLDQLASSGGAITLAQAQSTLGAGPIEIISAVAEGLAEADAARGLDAINRALDRGADARQLARQITEHLRQLMLMQVGGGKQADIPAEQRPAMESQAARLPVPQLVRAIKLFNQAASDLRSSWQPQLPLELAYVEAVMGEKQTSGAAAGDSTPSRAERSVPPVAPPASATPPAPQATVSAPPRAAHARATLSSAPVAPIKLTESHLPSAHETHFAPGAALSLEVVQQQWDHILAVLKTHGGMPVKALLSSCRLVNVEGSTLVLSWPSEILRGKYEDAKTKRLVEDIISEALGSRVMTRCVVGAKAKPGDDPLVQEAIKLGGRVVNA